jgi:hypothetical protein
LMDVVVEGKRYRTAAVTLPARDPAGGAVNQEPTVCCGSGHVARGYGGDSRDGRSG